MNLLFGEYRFTTDSKNASVEYGILSLYREHADPSLLGAETGVREVAQACFDEYNGHWYVDTLNYSIPLTIIVELVAEAKGLTKPISDPDREFGG